MGKSNTKSQGQGEGAERKMGRSNNKKTRKIARDEAWRMGEQPIKTHQLHTCSSCTRDTIPNTHLPQNLIPSHLHLHLHSYRRSPNPIIIAPLTLTPAPPPLPPKYTPRGPYPLHHPHDPESPPRPAQLERIITLRTSLVFVGEERGGGGKAKGNSVVVVFE